MIQVPLPLLVPRISSGGTCFIIPQAFPEEQALENQQNQEKEVIPQQSLEIQFLPVAIHFPAVTL